MDRARANLDGVASGSDPGQSRDPRNVDQHSGFAQTQLHQRHETVSAGNELGISVRGAELGDRIVHRRRARVFKRGGDHDRPPWMMRQSFSGRSIMSMCFTPNSPSASTAALTMHGVEPSVPASPTPLAPSGLTGVGVTVAPSSKRGKSMARGKA